MNFAEQLRTMKNEYTDEFTTNVTQAKGTFPMEDKTISAEIFPTNGKYVPLKNKSIFFEKAGAFCSSWKFAALMGTILAIWIIVRLILSFRV